MYIREPRRNEESSLAKQPRELSLVAYIVKTMGDSRLLDCNAPGFIKRYFATSRLHHLSTWKADIADFVIGQMAAKRRSPPYKASKIEEPFRTIMHIDMDCFFASVGVRDRPHLSGIPVAVAHSQGGVSLEYSTSEIASCNYEARSKGVKNGMFIGSAKELAPDLVIIPYEFEQYDACSKFLYQTLLGTADFVQSVSCDEAFVDITSCVHKRLMDATGLASVSVLQAHSLRDESFFAALRVNRSGPGERNARSNIQSNPLSRQCRNSQQHFACTDRDQQSKAEWCTQLVAARKSVVTSEGFADSRVARRGSVNQRQVRSTATNHLRRCASRWGAKHHRSHTVAQGIGRENRRKLVRFLLGPRRPRPREQTTSIGRLRCKLGHSLCQQRASRALSERILCRSV